MHPPDPAHLAPHASLRCQANLAPSSKSSSAGPLLLLQYLIRHRLRPGSLTHQICPVAASLSCYSPISDATLHELVTGSKITTIVAPLLLTSPHNRNMLPEVLSSSYATLIALFEKKYQHNC